MDNQSLHCIDACLGNILSAFQGVSTDRISYFQQNRESIKAEASSETQICRKLVDKVYATMESRGRIMHTNHNYRQGH